MGAAVGEEDVQANDPIVEQRVALREDPRVQILVQEDVGLRQADEIVVADVVGDDVQSLDPVDGHVGVLAGGKVHILAVRVVRPGEMPCAIGVQ